jgi:hypothetical protein
MNTTHASSAGTMSESSNKPCRSESGPAIPELLAPAPWQLKGQGIIFVYRFSSTWVSQHAHLQDFQKGFFRGGLGYVMLVDYQSSPVGPYRELLIIPGKFNPHHLQSISRIFVDSPASTQNGRFNWGIPKETLPMCWTTASNTDSFLVGTQSDPVFSCRIRSGGPSFPVTTRLLPIRLHQELCGKTFRTNPTGSGWGKLARIEHLQLDPNLFPDIRLTKPWACIKVNPFNMHFPSAT